MLAIVCHHCGEKGEYTPPISRRTECLSCQNDVRVCMNCRFYDETSYHECRESQASWVKEKEQGNFCSYFIGLGEHTPSSVTGDSMDKLEALFGNQSPSSIKTAAGSLDALFSKKPQTAKAGVTESLDALFSKKSQTPKTGATESLDALFSKKPQTAKAGATESLDALFSKESKKAKTDVTEALDDLFTQNSQPRKRATDSSLEDQLKDFLNNKK